MLRLLAYTPSQAPGRNVLPGVPRLDAAGSWSTDWAGIHIQTQPVARVFTVPFKFCIEAEPLPQWHAYLFV